MTDRLKRPGLCRKTHRSGRVAGAKRSGAPENPAIWGFAALSHQPPSQSPGFRVGASTHPTCFRHGQRNSRRGAVLVVAIVCVAVATTICFSIVKMAGLGRQATQTEAWRLQATWLVESGLERAAWQLASDNEYSGETWAIAADQLSGSETAAVEIVVEKVPDEPQRRLLRVRADYPNDTHRRVRRSKQVIVQLPAGEDAAEVAGGNEDTNSAEEEP